MSGSFLVKLGALLLAGYFSRCISEEDFMVYPDLIPDMFISIKFEIEFNCIEIFSFVMDLA